MDFSSDMDVKDTVEWSRKHFGEFVAANVKNEDMDGQTLIQLARSPDCITLLNRLGISRMKTILHFQELLHVLRPISCSSTNNKKRTQITERRQQQQQQLLSATPPIITTTTTTTTCDNNRTVSGEESLSPPTMDPSTSTSHTAYSSSMHSPQSILYSYDLADKALMNLQQRIIRNESRKKWPDTDLPTFRRQMDTSNIEELNIFVDSISTINALSGMSKELIRKKIINIIRERRKYVNKMQGEPKHTENIDNMSQASFVCRDGEEGNFHYHQGKVEVQSDTEHEAFYGEDDEEDCDIELTFHEAPARKKAKCET